MVIMPRIKKMLQRQQSALTVGRRRESEHTDNPHVLEEDALRAILNDDPNNERAFMALVGIVASNVASTAKHELTQYEGADPLEEPGVDPLFAHAGEDPGHTHLGEEEIAEESQLVAMWALAEEFTGHPKGWFPMVLMAMLSLDTSAEDCLRRLNAAISRDDTGKALARSIEMLRGSELTQEAYALGAGHWRAREHQPIAGVAVVRAALACGKAHEAHTHLEELLEHTSRSEIVELDPTLEQDVKEAYKEVEQDSH